MLGRYTVGLGDECLAGSQNNKLLSVTYITIHIWVVILLLPGCSGLPLHPSVLFIPFISFSRPLPLSQFLALSPIYHLPSPFSSSYLPLLLPSRPPPRSTPSTSSLPHHSPSSSLLTPPSPLSIFLSSSPSSPLPLPVSVRRRLS